jgi:hypothetical protein
MKHFRLPQFAWGSTDKSGPAHEPIVVDGVVLNGEEKGAGAGGGKFYGIRSYLHSFYVHPAIEEIECGKGHGTTWLV